MAFKALPESTSYRDPGSGEFFQRRGTVCDFGRIEPLWQPSSMFDNYVRTGDVAGKYGAFFQERSIDPLQAQSSSNNENELLAFGLPGASALIGRGLKKLNKLGKSYADNIPGIATADSQISQDPLNQHLTQVMLTGGWTGLGALGLRVLNAGATNAGTLDEAKGLGYYK